MEQNGQGDCTTWTTDGLQYAYLGYPLQCLDLEESTKHQNTDQQGKDLLRDLLKTADVLLENFKPGTMEKLGFGYDRIKEINPRLVYASISGFGQFGPYKDRPGYDIIGQAMGGLMSTTGWPDSPPHRTSTPPRPCR